MMSNAETRLAGIVCVLMTVVVVQTHGQVPQCPQDAPAHPEGICGSRLMDLFEQFCVAFRSMNSGNPTTELKIVKRSTGDTLQKIFAKYFRHEIESRPGDIERPFQSEAKTDLVLPADVDLEKIYSDIVQQVDNEREERPHILGSLRERHMRASKRGTNNGLACECCQNKCRPETMALYCPEF